MTYRQLLATLGFCTLLTTLSVDRAIARTVVTKSRDCGSFIAESVTEIIRAEGEAGSVLAQSVRLVNKSKHVDRRLDLLQHRSPNPDLDGARSLDAVAFQWGCARARTGRVFLFLSMSCENPGARSCTPGMGSPKNEWDLIFDDTGRSELPIPGTVSPADVRRLTALGLWPVMVDNKAYEDQEDLKY